jgi:hypothetical protein
MKDFIQYINLIAKTPIIPKNAKYTTTVLMPELDTTEGIYRSILPSYVINGSDNDLRMLISGIQPNLLSSNNDRDFQIPKDIVKASDNIVFPFVSFPLAPIINEIKAFKPSMKFTYYIDFNYYLLPISYPYANQYMGIEKIEQIEDNIKAVDHVICTNETLIDYIIAKLKERHPGVVFGTLFHYQRLYILPSLTKTDYANAHETGKLKVLIVVDDYHFPDINYVKGILKEFKGKHKEPIEISIIGWDGKHNGKKYLSETDFKFYSRVPFDKYFELVKHIAPDVLVIPGNVNVFNNTSKNYVKYLEFAYMNIPVIAPNITPYIKLITTNVNGFLCPDKESYLMQLETMFTEPAKFESVLGLAYTTAAVDYNIADAGNIEKLKYIYFPDYGKK